MELLSGRWKWMMGSSTKGCTRSFWISCRIPEWYLLCVLWPWKASSRENTRERKRWREREMEGARDGGGGVEKRNGRNVSEEKEEYEIFSRLSFRPSPVYVEEIPSWCKVLDGCRARVTTLKVSKSSQLLFFSPEIIWLIFISHSQQIAHFRS